MVFHVLEACPLPIIFTYFTAVATVGRIKLLKVPSELLIKSPELGKAFVKSDTSVPVVETQICSL